MTPQELRYSVYHFAFQGKLVPQNEEEVLTDRTAFSIDDAPYDIPDSWKWNTIGKCCEMYTGNSISESEKKAKYEGLQEGYDYIGTKDVSFEHVIAYNNGVRIPYQADFKVAYKDAILMCIEGGSAGRKIAILNRDVCFGNKLCMFKPHSLLNTFLYYYLQSIEFKKAFMDNMTGIIGGVSIKKLKDILLPIPPLAEQKRIVAKIEELLPLIDSYEQAWARLEAFNKRFPGDIQKSILQMAIQGKLVPQDPSEGTGEDLYQQIKARKTKLIKDGKIKREKPLLPITEEEISFDIPEGWIGVRLGELAYKITDGTHKTPHYTSDGIKFVSAKNLYSGVLSFSDCKYISPQEHAELYQRCNPEKGDLLISKSGSIGTVAMVDVDFEFSMFESLALIKYDQQLICQQFLRYALQDACYHLNPESVRGVAVKHLPIADINNLIVYLPPLAEQKRIVAELEKVLPLCERLKS